MKTLLKVKPQRDPGRRRALKRMSELRDQIQAGRERVKNLQQTGASFDMVVDVIEQTARLQGQLVELEAKWKPGRNTGSGWQNL